MSGSAIASRMRLSRSVSTPLTISSMSFPHWRATSRTTRGKRRKSCSTGTMRIFITERCRSFSTRDWKAMTSANFPAQLVFRKALGQIRCSVCCHMDLARISSPTRLSTLSILFGVHAQHVVRDVEAETDAIPRAQACDSALAVWHWALRPRPRLFCRMESVEARAGWRFALQSVTRAFCAIVGIRHLLRICSADLSEASAIST